MSHQISPAGQTKTTASLPAWHYFRELAIGALRYHDIPLLNLGFLPEQARPESGPAKHPPNNFMARIGERLLRSEFYTSYPAQQFAQGKR